MTMNKQPKIRVVIEIDQSRYLSDEEYTGLLEEELTDRVWLGRILDSGYCDVKIALESDATVLEKAADIVWAPVKDTAPIARAKEAGVCKYLRVMANKIRHVCNSL